MGEPAWWWRGGYCTAGTVQESTTTHALPPLNLSDPESRHLAEVPVGAVVSVVNDVTPVLPLLPHEVPLECR